jgi:hypothetical protein
MIMVRGSLRVNLRRCLISHWMRGHSLGEGRSLSGHRDIYQLVCQQSEALLLAILHVEDDRIEVVLRSRLNKAMPDSLLDLLLEIDL